MTLEPERPTVDKNQPWYEWANPLGEHNLEFDAQLLQVQSRPYGTGKHESCVHAAI